MDVWWVPWVSLFLIALIFLLLVAFFFEFQSVRKFMEAVSPMWVRNVEKEFPVVYNQIQKLGEYQLSLIQFKDGVLGTATTQEQQTKYFELLSDLALGRLNESSYLRKVDPKGAACLDLFASIENKYPYVPALLKEIADGTLSIETFKDKISQIITANRVSLRDPAEVITATRS